MLFDPNGGCYHESLWEDIGPFQRIDREGQSLPGAVQSPALDSSSGSQRLLPGSKELQSSWKEFKSSSESLNSIQLHEYLMSRSVFKQNVLPS